MGKSWKLLSKPDEMEMAISYRAMRMTWTIVNVVLVVLAVVFLMTGGQNPISLFVLLGVEMLFFVIKAFIGWSMTRGGKDN